MPHLHEVLVAPLRGEAALGPGVEHVQQRQVVPHVPPVERPVRVVRVHLARQESSFNSWMRPLERFLLRDVVGHRHKHC